MSFKSYTEKIKKKIGSSLILGQIPTLSIIPETDPDPHQNDRDPKHCLKFDDFFYKNLIIKKYYQVCDSWRQCVPAQQKGVEAVP